MIRWDLSTDQTQQRGFTDTRGAHDRRDLAPWHRQRDVFKYQSIAAREANVTDID
ncbi:hypothetical protein D3C76_1111300 [compost metagenome]